MERCGNCCLSMFHVRIDWYTSTNEQPNRNLVTIGPLLCHFLIFCDFTKAWIAKVGQRRSSFRLGQSIPAQARGRKCSENAHRYGQYLFSFQVADMVRNLQTRVEEDIIIMGEGRVHR